MSYILDALKRADAERTRGAVPGLHARQLPGSGYIAPMHTRHPVWLLTAGAALLAAVAVGLWLWRTPPEAPRRPEPLAAAPVAPAAKPLPMATQAARHPPPPTQPAVTAKAQGSSQNAAGQAVLPPPMGTSPARNAATTAANPAAATTAAPAVATSVAPPAAPVATPLLSELPDTLRSQVPALTITGTVYAEDPKQRLLLVNNQVLPQGSVVAPELTLEDIRPRSSVFNFRGTRFRVAH